MKEKDTVDSLNLLVSEKALLSLAFKLWDAETTGDPTRRGMEAKFIIRHLAIQVAARYDVVRALSSLDHPDDFAALINSDRRRMRDALFQATGMTGGTSAAQLNVGQPFRQAMEHARAVFESDWGDGFTAICNKARTQRGLKLHSATHICRRAPARSNPSGPCWYERIGLVQVIRAAYDYLRRSPTLQRRYLPDSLQSAEHAMFAGHAE